jgi:hypothetical protein
MNKEYVYLIAEQLYLNTTDHSLCNRNWLFAIYKSLLVTNEGDAEPIIWTKYNQWKIDHNCRASKTKAKGNNTHITDFNMILENEDCVAIKVTFIKKGLATEPITCSYKRIAFANDMWEFRNPNNESVLLSAYERDQLFNASIQNAEANFVDEINEAAVIIEETPVDARNIEKSKRTKKSNKSMTDEQIREMKFTALNLLLDQIRETYTKIEDPNQRSYLEVVIGAAIFYLPSLNAHFNGFISINALKGYLKKERRVKDHIYPRKLAARELLSSKLTLDELTSRYHDHLAQFMYITSSENSILVNYYEEHENHDLAMEAFQIEKFPTNDVDKFKSHNELDKFIIFLNGKNVQGMTKEEIMLLLKEFRISLELKK